MRFRERVVVVTGGGTGIGRATAVAFAREGARVAVLGRRLEPLESVAREIERAGAEAHPLAADITDPERLDATVAQILQAWGRIDVLVNNAGRVPEWTAVHETPLDVWDASLRVNLTGPFLMTRAALPHLIDSAGAIVNVSSVSALKGRHSVASYAAAKAGLIAFTRVVAAEYGWRGVRCNCVVPSWVETEMTAGFLADEAARGEVAARHASQRIAQPEEIARVILHLASADASFANGMEYLADGGMLAL